MPIKEMTAIIKPCATCFMAICAETGASTVEESEAEALLSLRRVVQLELIDEIVKTKDMAMVVGFDVVVMDEDTDTD
jgi:hypothetical protein